MDAAQLIGNRFQIANPDTDLLGRGGMGQVYRATDLHSGELVAVKALNPEVVSRAPEALERFMREGEALRQLNHPNIVRLVAAVEEAGRHYLVMEYMARGSLADLLQAQGRLPVERVVDIGLDLADALTRAHRLGILHRDLKPANVLLAGDGTPRLADFGIARLGGGAPLTQAGVLIGTVDYLSPEACRGEPLDERSDIWSFGVLLLELLAGRVPFSGDTVIARLHAILTQPLPDLAQLVPGLPDALADLLVCMLEKDHEQRIASVRQVGLQLEAMQKGWPVSTLSATPARGDVVDSRFGPASAAGGEPDEETTELYEQMWAGTLKAPIPSGSPLPPAIETSVHPDVDQPLDTPVPLLPLEIPESQVRQAQPGKGTHEERARLRLVTWALRGFLVIGTAITLFELLGLSFKGLRFLGGVAMQPQLTLAAVVVIASLVWLSCGYVILRRQRIAVTGRSSSPAFGPRERVAAGLVLVLNAAITLLLIFGVLRYDVVNAQSVAEGQLGIAVAEFGEGVDFRESGRARELSVFVARALRQRIELSPGLAGKVTVISAPLVGNEKEAEEVARKLDVALIIWGWVSEEDAFVPSFTFVEPPNTEIGLKEIPVWFEVEISGGGTQQLSETFAQRTSGLIEYAMGLLYLNEHDYDRAAMVLQRAISQTAEVQSTPITIHEQRAMSRTLAIFHLALGRTYAARGEPEKALSEYDTATGYDPEYGPIYIGVGNLHYSAGEFQEALRWYQEAVRLVPETRKAAALYSRGNAYFFLGQYDAAAADYELAIAETEPDDKALGRYHLVLGITLCYLGRFAQGFGHLSQAQQLAETDTSVSQDAKAERNNCEATATTMARLAVTARPQVPTPFPTWRPIATQTATATPAPATIAVPSPAASLLPTISSPPLRETPSKTPMMSPVVPGRPSRPLTNTPTPTSRVTIALPHDYPVPILLEPEDGAAGDSLTLRWQWEGTLQEDEWFDVRVWKAEDAHYGIAWVKEPEFRLDKDSFQNGAGEFHWAVAVIRGHGGRWEADLSPESEARRFTLFATGRPAGPFVTATAMPP